MALPKEVQDALSRVQLLDDTESEWADIDIADWKTIHTHLLSLDENASLHAEIERLQSGIAKHINRVCELQDRLAAADALLREVYDHGENMALHEKIAAHLSGEHPWLRRWCTSMRRCRATGLAGVLPALCARSVA